MNLTIEAIDAILQAEKKLNEAKLHLKRINSPLASEIEKIHKQLIPYKKVYHQQMEAIVKGEVYQP